MSTNSTAPEKIWHALQSFNLVDGVVTPATDTLPSWTSHKDQYPPHYKLHLQLHFVRRLRPANSAAMRRAFLPCGRLHCQCTSGQLEKSKNSNVFTTDWPILTKFGMTVHLGPRENERVTEMHNPTFVAHEKYCSKKSLFFWLNKVCLLLL